MGAVPDWKKTTGYHTSWKNTAIPSSHRARSNIKTGTLT